MTQGWTEWHFRKSLEREENKKYIYREIGREREGERSVVVCHVAIFLVVAGCFTVLSAYSASLPCLFASQCFEVKKILTERIEYIL